MNWSSLLSTKCEDRDSCLSLYSKTKGILHKLTKGNLITATEDVFLKAYFSMTIEAKEFQQEVKGLIRYTSTAYSETLELIHSDFHVQTTGENLHDTSTRSGSTAIVKRDKVDNDDVLPKTNALPMRVNIAFPNNHGKLLHSDYYHQFREWFYVLTKPKEKRTSKELSWIESFKLNFDTKPTDT